MTTVTIPTSRPITFMSRMVNAIRNVQIGTWPPLPINPSKPWKWQTRRLARFKPLNVGLNLGFSGLSATNINGRWYLMSRGAGACWNERTRGLKCRYGDKGDWLWVQESFWNTRADQERRTWGKGGVIYRADSSGLIEVDGKRPKWMSGRFMQQWASRITLEVVRVRCERLFSITEEDAVAEGVPTETLSPDPDNFHPPGSYGYLASEDLRGKGLIYQTAREAFIIGFRDLHKLAKHVNPWLLVIEFKPLKVEP